MSRRGKGRAAKRILARLTAFDPRPAVAAIREEGATGLVRWVEEQEQGYGERWDLWSWACAVEQADAGSPEWLWDLLRMHWQDGGSAVPCLDALVRAGQREIAAAWLAEAPRPDPREAEVVEAFRKGLEDVEQAWRGQLEALVAAPSAALWEALFDDLSPRACEVREAQALAAMREAGIPAAVRLAVAFRGRAPGGDAWEDCRTGEVDPDALLALAEHAPEERARWLELAGLAAYVRGDRKAAVALLALATDVTECFLCAPMHTVAWLRSLDDPEVERMLDEAGVP